MLNQGCLKLTDLSKTTISMLPSPSSSATLNIDLSNESNQETMLSNNNDAFVESKKNESSHSHPQIPSSPFSHLFANFQPPALSRPTEDLGINWLNVLKRQYTILREALFKYDYEQRISQQQQQQQQQQNSNKTNSNESLNLSDLSTASSFDFKKQLIKSVTFHFKKNLENVTPQTFSNESFAKKSNQSCLKLISLLKDRMLQVLHEQREPYEPMLQRAQALINANSNNHVFEGHNASNESVLNAAKALCVRHTRDYINLLQNVPGLIDFLDLSDVVTLAEDNLCLIFGLKVTKLFVHGEFYVVSSLFIRFD